MGAAGGRTFDYRINSELTVRKNQIEEIARSDAAYGELILAPNGKSPQGIEPRLGRWSADGDVPADGSALASPHRDTAPQIGISRKGHPGKSNGP